MHHLRVILLFPLILLFAGCSTQQDVGVADLAVPRFHQMLDDGRFADIYGGASSELTSSSTEQDFVALLAAVHRKLGNSAHAEKVSWSVSYLGSGTFVNLFYKTGYAGGEASEQFVFRIDGKVAKLAGYHINAPALILN